MTNLRLNIEHQTRITTYASRNPAAARTELTDFAKSYPGAPKGLTTAARLQLANAVIGQPVNAFWHEVLSDWAQTLPLTGLSTLPPAPHEGVTEHTIVRWLPGEVSRRDLADGRTVWKSTEICPRLGMKEDHASKHKGTLDESDYVVQREGNRQSMWVTKRGILKLIVRSRDAGVRGTLSNMLLNQILDVYVDFVDTGVVIHPAATREDIDRALDRSRTQELEQALAENRRLRTEVRRLHYALDVAVEPTEPEVVMLPPPAEIGQGPPDGS